MKSTHSLGKLLCFIVIVLLGLNLSSCGGDDEKDNSPNVPVNSNKQENSGTQSGANDTQKLLDASLLIGKWKATVTEKDYEITTFRADKTFTSEGIYNGGYNKEDGTWKLNIQTHILTLYHEYYEENAEITKLTETELVYNDFLYKRIDDSADDENQSGNNTNDSNRGEVATSFKGSGTLNSPFIISKASELRKLSDDCANGETYSGKYFVMTTDIVINRNVLSCEDTAKLEKWIPIMDFEGYFNGQGYSVKGIYINNPSLTYCGLFGRITKATVRNIVVEDSYMKIGGCVGGIVGLANPESVVSCCCYINAIIEGGKSRQYIGGIIGYGKGTQIVNCANYAKVTADGYGCGGIVGGTQKYKETDCVVINCVNKGLITGWNPSAGGIAGGCGSHLTIKNCVNYGTVNCGAKDAGAIVGVFTINSTLTNNYYLEGCAKSLYSKIDNFYQIVKTNNVAMTSEQMKEQTFLDKLNNSTKALGSSYSQWKFGKGGYPTLDYVNE